MPYDYEYTTQSNEKWGDVLNKEYNKKRFADYTNDYNIQDPKIKLKVDHTYRVADLCAQIADSIGLSEDDVQLAWLCGLLHDIGRFEQIRQYGTFSDAASIDHALLSTLLLFGDSSVSRSNQGNWEQYANDNPDFALYPEKLTASIKKGEALITDYDCKEEWYPYLANAILWHSAYRVPSHLSKRSRLFADILRDADKIDILRVNLETPLEDIYNLPKEEFLTSQVTPEVMLAFDDHHCILRSLKKTAIDHPVGHISLVYELVFPISKRIVHEQGYLEQLLHLPSNNPITQKQLDHIRREMHSYLEQFMEGI